MKRIVLAAAIVLAASELAFADVTITSTVAGGLMGAGGMQSVQYIKGSKMRVESSGSITILDAEKRQMVVLNPARKEADVYDMTKLNADIQKTLGGGTPSVDVKPTGQRKDCSGRPCEGHEMRVSMPMQMGTESITVILSGPVWVVKNAPGTADYSAFYTKAAASGLFIGSPEQAKGAGPQMKSQMEMYRAIAEMGGLPYEVEMSIGFDGTGAMAQMMNKIGRISTKTTVTAVSTNLIADDKFSVPVDYKTRNR